MYIVYPLINCVVLVLLIFTGICQFSLLTSWLISLWLTPHVSEGIGHQPFSWGIIAVPQDAIKQSFNLELTFIFFVLHLHRPWKRKRDKQMEIIPRQACIHERLSATLSCRLREVNSRVHYLSQNAGIGGNVCVTHFTKPCPNKLLWSQA